jgi:predicted Zn-dependent protease
MTEEPQIKKSNFKREIFKALINILLGFVIGIFSRYYVDYVYESMRKGGLTPLLPYVHTDNKGDLRKADVYLIPFEGFSDVDASGLSVFLSKDLNIVVKATGCMPVPNDTYDPTRQQHVADRFGEYIHNYSKTLSDTKPNTIYIGILADDMYPENSNWNFCLSANFEKVSIIATDRLVPHGVTDKQQAGKIYGDRLLKMLKRVIGMQYFGYPRSSDPRSLMFSPLMGVDELDRMELNYSENDSNAIKSKL